MIKRVGTHTSDLFDEAIEQTASARKPEAGTKALAASRQSGAASEAPEASAAKPGGIGLSDERFLTDKQVAGRYGVSRATVWGWVKAYPDFPRPHRITPGTTRWYLSELKAHEAAVVQPKPPNAK